MRNYRLKVNIVYGLLLIISAPLIFIYNFIASLIRLRNPVRAFWLTRHVTLSIWQDRHKKRPLKS